MHLCNRLKAKRTACDKVTEMVELLPMLQQEMKGMKNLNSAVQGLKIMLMIQELVWRSYRKWALKCNQQRVFSQITRHQGNLVWKGPRLQGPLVAHPVIYKNSKKLLTNHI